MLQDIVEVEVVGAHRLRLRFEDGAEGEIDVASLVRFEGVFAALRDPEVFSQVEVDPEVGSICWPSGADLDPDVLYAIVKGEAVPDLTRRPEVLAV